MPLTSWPGPLSIEGKFNSHVVARPSFARFALHADSAEPSYASIVGSYISPNVGPGWPLSEGTTRFVVQFHVYFTVSTLFNMFILRWITDTYQGGLTIQDHAE